MDRYWVSFAIANRQTGALEGASAVEIGMVGPPADHSAVSRLVEDAAEHARALGQLAVGQYAIILGWSRMGG